MIPIPFTLFSERTRTLYARRRPTTAGRVDQVLATLALLRDGRRPIVRTTADLTTDTACRFVDWHGPHFNSNTLRGYLGSLSAICSYAVSEGWLDRTPQFARIRPRPSPPIRKRYLGYSALRGLLLHLRDRRPGDWKSRRDYALGATLSLTGLRRDEALHLRLDQVGLAGRVIRVRPTSEDPLKTLESARDVPIADELAEVLRGWIPWACGGDWLFPNSRKSGPWTGGSARDRPLGRLQSAAREVGIEWISLHALRHSFATIALRQWQMPLWTVQRILGHTSMRTTEKYLHWDDDASELLALARPIGFGLAEPRDGAPGPA